MKKLTALLLALAMVLAMAACGNSRLRKQRSCRRRLRGSRLR